jgi:hypothetical protein
MSSVPDGRDGAGDPAAVFDAGDRLAAMLSRLDDEFTRQVASEYHRQRVRLLGALWGLLPEGVPIGQAAAWVDGAFPRTLAEVYRQADRLGWLGPTGGAIGLVSRWSPDGWNRLQEALLPFVDGVEPSTATSSASAGPPAGEPRTPGRVGGRPRGSGKRSPGYYRDRFLELREVLDKRPLEDEFLRYLVLIEAREAGEGNRRPTPSEIRACVRDPDPKKFDRKTLARNLGSAHWPYERFWAWAERGDEAAP